MKCTQSDISVKGKKYNMNIEIILAIKNWCVNLLSDSVTGSIIGLFGLFVSVWSLIETKLVKKYVEKEKTVAIDKYRFINSKKNFVNQLDRQLKSIKDVKRINRNACNELMTMTQQILQYESIFNKEDKDYLDNSKKIYRDLSSKGNYVADDYITVIERITQIIIILEKGEYSK